MDQKLAPGSSLGPYTIIRLIAKGGMGEVYEAYEEVLHRSVALKIITDAAINEIPEVLSLFRTEGKALAQLNHPNVVTIYQLGHDKGIHYIAMEYIEGLPLDEYMQKKTPDLKRDLHIFYRILMGVQALHRKGVIHRDLKPKNVIIQGDKVVKIVDFGIAEITRENQREVQETTVVMGSVYYMSPEVSKGQKATFQSDIWSLGIILYQLLTRQRPFTGQSQTEILNKIRDDAMTFPAVTGIVIPPKYKEITQKMCHRNPSERYQSIDEIIADLGVSSQAQTPKRYTEILLGLGATGLALLAAWQIYKSNNPPEQPIATVEPPVSSPAAMPVIEPPATATTQTQPAPVAQTPTTLTTLTTLPSPSSPVTEPSMARTEPQPQPPAVSIKPRPEPLPITKLKPSETKITLRFGSGTSGRDPASVQKSILNLPVLAWNKTLGAASYRLQISTDPAFERMVLNKEVFGTAFKWESAGPGTFYWRVQALARGRPRGEFSNTANLHIQLPAPTLTKTAFKFVAKAATRTTQKNVIEWNPLPLASRYQVTIAKKDGSRVPVLTQIVQEHSLAFSNLPNGDYNLQVVALDSQRQIASVPSAPATIQIQSASKLLTPVLQQPSNGTTVPSQGTMITPIACSWSKVKQVTAYEFQLAADPGFKNITHQTNTNKNQYVVILPLPKGKFYWRVRATSQNEDPSSWSEPRMFKID